MGDWYQVGQTALIEFNHDRYAVFKNDRKFVTRYLGTRPVKRKSGVQVINWLMLPQLFDFHGISRQIRHDMGVEV